MNKLTEYDFDFFVSHSQGDQDSAQKLVEHLKRFARRCWNTTSSTAASENDAANANSGLARSESLIVLLSHRSLESAHIAGEVEQAAILGHSIYVVRIEDVQPSKALAKFLSPGTIFDAFPEGNVSYLNDLMDEDDRRRQTRSILEKRPTTPDANPSPPKLRFRYPAIIKILLYVLLGWASLHFNLFGFERLSNRASEQFFYNIVAPLYGKGELWGAGSSSLVTWNKNITVLLIDDTTLEAADLSWPLSIGYHKDVISELYETYEPEVIMIDLSFIDRRDGDKNKEGTSKEKVELEKFMTLLKTIKRNRKNWENWADEESGEYWEVEEHGEHKASKTKIYLAADSTRQKDANILNELRDVATLVMVGWPYPDNFVEDPLYYPMARHEKVGETPLDEGAAYTIYRDLCAGSSTETRTTMHCPSEVWLEPHFHNPMQVFWGVDAPGLNWEQSNLGKYFNCKSVSKTLIGRLWAFFGHTAFNLDNEFIQTCPYSQMILARHLMDTKFRKFPDVEIAYEEALGPTSKGPKIIFYGAHLQGMEDTLFNYTHGKIAGVFLHAMAFDNLLTLGPDYIQFSTEGWTVEIINIVLLIAIAAILVFLADFRYIFMYANFGPKKVQIFAQKLQHLRDIGPILALTRLALALVVIVLTMGLSFLYFRLSPLNWLGFLGLVGTYSLSELSGFNALIGKIMIYIWTLISDFFASVIYRIKNVP